MSRRAVPPPERCLRRPSGSADMRIVAALFREYAETMDFDLCFQDFESELRDLPGAYAPPTGALILAERRGEAVGVVGLRDLGDGACEMKRLYLRPAARGDGLGQELLDAVLEEARRLGYRRMRLDTIPGYHDRAITAYRARGFREIGAYTHNPVPGALFMELDLG